MKEEQRNGLAKRPAKETTQTTIRVDIDTWTDINRIAEKMSLTQAEIAKMAIEAYRSSILYEDRARVQEFRRLHENVASILDIYVGMAKNRDEITEGFKRQLAEAEVRYKTVLMEMDDLKRLVTAEAEKAREQLILAQRLGDEALAAAKKADEDRINALKVAEMASQNAKTMESSIERLESRIKEIAKQLNVAMEAKQAAEQKATQLEDELRAVRIETERLREELARTEREKDYLVKAARLEVRTEQMDKMEAEIASLRRQLAVNQA